MKLILTIHSTDNMTYAGDHNFPFEYHSKEEASNHLQTCISVAINSGMSYLEFCGHMFDVEQISQNPPEIQTIDEWFESNLCTA